MIAKLMNGKATKNNMISEFHYSFSHESVCLIVFSFFYVQLNIADEFVCFLIYNVICSLTHEFIGYLMDQWLNLIITNN